MASTVSPPPMTGLGPLSAGTVNPAYYVGETAYSFYSPPPPTTTYKATPRITRVKVFSQSGSSWYDTSGGGDFEGWQRSNPNVLITGTHPVWNPSSNQLQLVVTYSEELV